MEKLFENKTSYTTDEYDKFQEFHYDRYRFSYLGKTIVFSLLLLFLCICQFIVHQFITGFILLLCLAIFLIWRLWYPNYYNKKEQYEKIAKNHTQITFSFYPYYFYVTNGKKKRRFYYFNVHRIYETDFDFYLYLNSERAFLLSKEGFILGTPEDFLMFIKSRTFFKYRK